MKYSITMRLFLALVLGYCCFAAPSLRATVMEHEKYLDNDSNVLLRWTVLEATEEIEMELKVNCTGWTGISFARGIVGQPGSYGDIIMGGYVDETGQGFIQDRWIDLSVPEPVNGGIFDNHTDLTLLNAEYQEPHTVLRFLRKIVTGDWQDIDIDREGAMLVSWTYAIYDDTEIPHENGVHGFALVNFFPVK